MLISLLTEFSVILLLTFVKFYRLKETGCRCRCRLLVREGQRMPLSYLQTDMHLVKERESSYVVSKIYCCIINYPQNFWLKTAHIYYLTFSVGRECEHWLSVSSALLFLTRLQSKYGQVMWPHLKSQVGKDLPSSFTWLLTEFSFLQSVGLWALWAVSHGFLNSFQSGCLLHGSLFY